MSDAGFDSYDKESLCNQLKLFFANAESKGGEYCKLDTFNQLVFALKEHLLKHGHDLNGDEFGSSRDASHQFSKIDKK